MGSPVTITPDPSSSGPVRITPDAPKPRPGWLDQDIPLDSHWNATMSGVQSIGRGFRSMGQGLWNMAKPPENLEEGVASVVIPGIGHTMLRGNKSLLQSVRQGTEVPGAIHDINQSPDPTGVYAKVAQDTAGEGAAQAMGALATEGAGRLPGAVSRVAESAPNLTAKVKAVGRLGAEDAASHIPGVGRVFRRPSLADYVKAVRTKAPAASEGAEVYRDATEGNAPYAGEEQPYNIQDWWRSRGGTFKAERPNGPIRAPRPTPSPSTPLPAQPATVEAASEPTLLDQVQESAAPSSVSGEVTIVGRPQYPLGRNIDLSPGMQTPGGAVVAPRIRGLLSAPEGSAASTSEPTLIDQVKAQPRINANGGSSIDTSPQRVQSLLNDATGAAPRVKPVPGVPLKNQIAAQRLPEGFTPTPESSALRGYKYNPATQEFDAITNTGTYRHGQVTPEHVAEFQSAKSAGQAWSKLRNQPGVTPLGKVDLNGNLVPRVKPQFMRSAEVDPVTGEPEFSDVLERKKQNLSDFIRQDAAKSTTKPTLKQKVAASDAGDLTSQLEESVKQASAAKSQGGVLSSADPKALGDRWGVSEQSLKSGRSQTRGWGEMETEDELNRMADRYRKGEAVDPVIEVRDANNNLLSVDGRGRVIAAQRAGVKRVPVIVRRLQ